MSRTYRRTSENTENGKRLLSLCKDQKLKVMNIFFQKSVRKRVTWYNTRAGKGAMLTNKSQVLKIIGIRTSREVDVNTDHCLLTTKIKIDDLHIRKNESFRKKCDKKKWNSIYGLEEIKKRKDAYQNHLLKKLPEDISSTTHEDILNSFKEAAKQSVSRIEKRKNLRMAWSSKRKTKRRNPT